MNPKAMAIDSLGLGHMHGIRPRSLINYQFVNIIAGVRQFRVRAAVRDEDANRPTRE